MSDDWQVVEEALKWWTRPLASRHEKSLGQPALAALTRLREREAQLEQAKAHQKLLTLDAEARVAQLEREFTASRIDVARLEEALREFADEFPGNNEMWRSVQVFARRALAHEDEKR